MSATTTCGVVCWSMLLGVGGCLTSLPPTDTAAGGGESRNSPSVNAPDDTFLAPNVSTVAEDLASRVPLPVDDPEDRNDHLTPHGGRSGVPLGMIDLESADTQPPGFP